VQNLVVRETVVKSVESVRNGSTLTDALGNSGLMPTLVMRMISLGERVGTLEQSLDHVASYYDREVPGIIDRVLAIFNAVLIASLGLMLAAIALGIFVPLYQMMGNLDAAP
jgi:type IV pilus assembly protein PilC